MRRLSLLRLVAGVTAVAGLACGSPGFAADGLAAAGRKPVIVNQAEDAVVSDLKLEP